MTTQEITKKGVPHLVYKWNMTCSSENSDADAERWAGAAAEVPAKTAARGSNAVDKEADRVCNMRRAVINVWCRQRRQVECRMSR